MKLLTGLLWAVMLLAWLHPNAEEIKPAVVAAAVVLGVEVKLTLAGNLSHEPDAQTPITVIVPDTEDQVRIYPVKITSYAYDRQFKRIYRGIASAPTIVKRGEPLVTAILAAPDGVGYADSIGRPGPGVIHVDLIR